VLCCMPRVGVCIVWSHTLCVDVCVMLYIVCMCMLLKKIKGNGCFSGVEADLVCVRKGQRIKAEEKNRLKDMYRNLFQFLLCM